MFTFLCIFFGCSYIHLPTDASSVVKWGQSTSSNINNKLHFLLHLITLDQRNHNYGNGSEEHWTAFGHCTSQHRSPFTTSPHGGKSLEFFFKMVPYLPPTRPPSVPIGFVPQKLNLTAKLDWLTSSRKSETMPTAAGSQGIPGNLLARSCKLRSPSTSSGNRSQCQGWMASPTCAQS